jgi:hypothetical protein
MEASIIAHAWLTPIDLKAMGACYNPIDFFVIRTII